MSDLPTTSIPTPHELLAAPMDEAHRDLVLRHYYRLIKVLHEADEASIGNYTNKQAAREQLARMTLIIRDYLKLAKDNTKAGEEHIESMVADVVDASLSVTGSSATFSQPVFITSQLWGREQEIASLMQEFDAEGADDVIELWNVVKTKSNKVLPDHCSREDLGRDVDWNDVLCRSRSEDNLLGRKGEWEVQDGVGGRTVVERELVENRAECERQLMGRQLEELDLVWPPKFRDPEPNVGRQRRRTNTLSISTGRRRGSVVGNAVMSL